MLHTDILNCLASKLRSVFNVSENSTQMYYFKLMVDKSAIDIITEKLKDFVFNKAVYVKFVGITTSKYFYYFKNSVFWLIFSHWLCTVESNYHVLGFFSNQPVGTSRVAQSVPASQVTNGVIKCVNLIIVAAKRHASSPKTPLTCAFMKTQVSHQFYWVCMCMHVHFWTQMTVKL